MSRQTSDRFIERGRRAPHRQRCAQDAAVLRLRSPALCSRHASEARHRFLSLKVEADIHIETGMPTGTG